MNQAKDSIHTIQVLEGLIGSYTIPDALELAGDTYSLIRLARAVEMQPAVYALDLPYSSNQPTYDKLLTTMRILDTDNLVRIHREEKCLIISGSASMRDVFARNIQWLANQKQVDCGVQLHIHIEYYPEHFFLDSLSAPLLVKKC